MAVLDARRIDEIGEKVTKEGISVFIDLEMVLFSFTDFEIFPFLLSDVDVLLFFITEFDR